MGSLSTDWLESLGKEHWEGVGLLLVHSLLVLTLAWLALRFLSFLIRLVETSMVEKRSGAAQRVLKTQLAVLHRVASVAIYMVAFALLLIQFPMIRTLGVSLLASAGVATLIVGLAAQKPMGALLAGIQLSITQPVRIGDWVVIEGESGNIEEINLTYAVVRAWDLRRVVIPISYFLEKPFQNWTKGPPALYGTVKLHVDFEADVEKVRHELDRVLKKDANKLWDGKVAKIEVTEAQERTQTLRILLSAANSDDSWDLCCLVREHMVQFLRENPEWLPVQRLRNVSTESAA